MLFNDIPASLEKIPWAAPVNLADILLELEKGTDFHRPAMSIYTLEFWIDVTLACITCSDVSVLHFSIQGLLLSSIGVFLIAAVRDS
jgi:hypothetical protein